MVYDIDQCGTLLFTVMPDATIAVESMVGDDLIGSNGMIPSMDYTLYLYAS